MIRKHPILMVLALSCIAGTAWSQGQVELKGTVKDGSGKAIEGVIVSITKGKMKDTTDSKGEFNITDITTGIQTARNYDLNKISFNINGQKVFFSLTSETKNVSIDIISANGQKAFATAFDNNVRSNIEIPQLKSGIYLLKLKAGSQQLVQKIITTGEQLIFSDIASSVNGGSANSLRLASSANVDTIVATKSGYVTKKVAVDSYKKSGIAIVLEKEPVGPVTCKLSDLPATSALKENKKLPNPFAFFDGTEITKKSEWPCLRKEILNMAYKYMYGPMPPFEAPDVEVKGTVSSSGVKADISYKGKSASLNFGTSGSGDVLLIAMGSGITPPQAHRTYSISNTVLNGWKTTCKNLFGITPCGEIAVGWGCNILCRAIASDPAGGIDTNKIMTTGCSNTAKAAFLAGAFCEGIDLTVIVESGGFGDASFRVAEYFAHGSGKGKWNCADEPQGVWKPDYGSQWLAEPYMDANVSSWVVKTPGNIWKLPYDQHCLVACIAPRACCLLTNQNGGKEWCHLNGTGSAITGWAAEPVWNALGVPENFGFLMYPDENGQCPYHCSNPKSAKDLAGEFFKRVFEGNTSAKTDVFETRDADLQQKQSEWKDTWADWDMERTLE